MQRITADKRMLARRFRRGMATYEGAAVVQSEMAAALVADLLSASATDRFEHVLELGCGTGLLTGRLVDHCRLSCLVLNDLVAESGESVQRVLRRKPGVMVTFVPGDMETIDLPDDQDLVISNAVLQWAADPPSLLRRMTRLLRTGGVLALASFGPANLLELSAVAGLSLHYPSLAQWHASLAGDYEVLSGRETLRTLWFPSAGAVLRHLKETGVNALATQPWPPAKIMRFCRTYETTFGRQAEVPLTYNPVFIIARKHHDGGGRR